MEESENDDGLGDVADKETEEINIDQVESSTTSDQEESSNNNEIKNESALVEDAKGVLELDIEKDIVEVVRRLVFETNVAVIDAFKVKLGERFEKSL